MLRTTCHFNAHNKSTTTFYGPGTCDEMCYGFITYYPLQNMPDPECTAWKSLLGCDPSTLKGCDPHAFFTDITTFAKSEVYSNITSACKVFGLCQTECKRAIREARSREPCMRNETTGTPSSGEVWVLSLAMLDRFVSDCNILLALLCLVPAARTYRHYADQIPNGARVPVPCKNNVLWHGVGHLNVEGGGERNVFGLDFAAAGHKWTADLCNKDSDGDGKSNGQELGDPQCTWTPGSIPQSSTGITHPDAGDVPYKIQREWMKDVCKSAEFDCDGLNKTEDVRELVLRLPLTPVPAKETTYMCMMFEINDTLKEQDYHVIANTPIINNSYVMHHMLLYGCRDDSPMYGPVECNMGSCQDLIGGWALGITGNCLHENAGVRIGKTGFKRMLIQYHWNNPAERTDFEDSSGLTLHYTPNVRPNDMAMLMTGQDHIVIPPRSLDTVITSDCTNTCTRNKLTGDIYVTTAADHMHYLGKSMSIEHYRDGKFLRYFTNEHVYNYDTPKFFDFEDPVLVKPGDMIRTTCHFASPDKPTTTFQGDGTSDEMCLGFLSFYPANNIPGSKWCTSWRSMLSCDPPSNQGCDRLERWKWVYGFNNTEVYINITSSCLRFGYCTVECKAAIREARSREACMKAEDGWKKVKWHVLPRSEEGRLFLASLASCEVELFAEDQASLASCEVELFAEDQGILVFGSLALSLTRAEHQGTSTGTMLLFSS
ncbi:hypothetical protein BaRGS_00001779, partial [Batillaria attramentaria]